jgi:PAS domain S-box-containing protein
MVFDGETRQFLEVNNACLKLYGYTRKEFMKLRHSDITAEPEQSEKSIKQTVSGKINRIPLRYHKKKDGTTFPVEISTKSFEQKGRTLLCGVIRDITDRTTELEEERLSAERLESQWKIASIFDADQQFICDFTLNEILKLTKSNYSFYGFMNEDESAMTVHSWSKNVMKDCAIHKKPLVFSIENSGVWGNAIRERGILIINDYQEKHPNKKGLPEGHVSITRLMVVPVFKNKRIVAVGAVADKESDYTKKDSDQMNAFLQSSQIIQDKRTTEKALIESEAKYKAILSALPDLMFRLSRTGDHLDYYASAVNELYIEPKEFLGKRVDEVLPSDVADKYLLHIQQALDTGEMQVFEYSLDFPEGLRHYEARMVVSGNDETLAIAREITKRKMAEHDVRKSMDLLSLIGNAQELFIAKSSYEQVFRALLNALVSITESEYGFVDEVLRDENGEMYKLSLAISDISWDEESFRLYEQLKNRGLEFRNLNNLSGAPVTTGKLVISNNPSRDPRSGGLPKGHPSIHNFMGIPMYFGGELVGVAGVANRTGGYDERLAEFLEPFITTCASIIQAIRSERQQQVFTEALRESEHKYRLLIENANDAIFLADVETRIIIDANKQGEILMGRPISEIIGLHQSHLHPEEEADNYKKIFEKYIKVGGKTTEDLYVIREDGRKFPIEISSSIIELEGRKVIQGVFHDITERKRMEEELLKSDKLESLGVLAGGIAHDFNNLLQSIFLNVSAAKVYSEKGSKAYEMLQETINSLERTRDLTQQLLTFSKGGEPVKKRVSLKTIIPDTVKFALSGSNVKSSISIAADLLPVDADAGQISQVIQNIVINADQSMPGGGIIKVKAENIAVDAEGDLALEAGKYSVIHIEDSGIGMPSGDLSRIFDPFFTTKERGSGLGLATAYSIIKKHGGLIKVESGIGVGTTFGIYLPVSEGEIREGNGTDYELLKGEGRVLVMDDERSMRPSISLILKKLGYEVEFADEGSQALEMYKRSRETGRPFDAAILDLTVPGGMGGEETIEKLLELDPEVKAIVSSGYSDDSVMADHSNYGFKAALIKPYGPEKLSRVLHAVIKGTDN